MLLRYVRNASCRSLLCIRLVIGVTMDGRPLMIACTAGSALLFQDAVQDRLILRQGGGAFVNL